MLVLLCHQPRRMTLFGIIIWLLAILCFCVSIALLLFRQKSELIFGKYPNKGIFYYLKYRLALLALKYLRRKLYPENDFVDLDKLERPQVLTSNPQSYDVVSFMGANEYGTKLMVTMERRRRGVVKACIYLWLPNDGLYCSPNLPDMVYFTTNGRAENLEFRGAGLHIYPEECMRTWRIQYNGELRKANNDDVIVNVKMNICFNSTASYFNYNRDLSAAVIADSVAREAWNDTFFGMLKCVDKILERRTHYEQNGVLEGIIELNELEIELKLKGFRDHGFGTERSLSTINRYVYVALFLDDGTNMVIGNLSQPSFFLSSLKVGYICQPDGVYMPITGCNFELYSYGERNSEPPKHKNFIVETEHVKYFVQIEEEESALRFMGGEWHSKVFNQFIRCTVNGIKGHGITEYLYRHEGGRPESVSSNDPEWYQNVRKYERTLSTGQAQENDDDVFIF